MLYIMLASLAALSKIPAVIYFVLLLPLAFHYKHLKRSIFIFTWSIVPLALCYWWYFIWSVHLSETYGEWYNLGRKFSTGSQEILTHFNLVLERFYFSTFHSFVLFSLCLFGVVMLIKHKSKTLLIVLLLLGGMFGLYMLKSGYFFYHHNYYIIPFVPVMALLVGYGLSCIKIKHVAVLLLAIGMVESIANQHHDVIIKETEKYKLELENIADKVTAKDDWIAINGNANPQQMYLAHRKGWTINDAQISDERFLKSIASKGCKFLFVNKHYTKSRYKKSAVIYADEHFIVYALN